MNDRFIKTLLVLIAVALWGLLLRAQPAPAPAGAPEPSRPAPPAVTTTLPSAAGGLRFLTISNGKVSVWKVHLSEEGKDKLYLQDFKSLP